MFFYTLLLDPYKYIGESMQKLKDGLKNLDTSLQSKKSGVILQ